MKLPRIRNPLFVVVLAIVSFAAFAEPSDTTNGKEIAPEWIKADSSRNLAPTDGNWNKALKPGLATTHHQTVCDQTRCD